MRTSHKRLKTPPHPLAKNQTIGTKLNHMPSSLKHFKFPIRTLVVVILGVFSSYCLIGATTENFQDLARFPDEVSVTTESGEGNLSAETRGIWKGERVTVTPRGEDQGLKVQLAAPTMAVISLRLHWNVALPADWKYLGDAWERAYGDLEWKPLDGKRVMPWYFLASDGKILNGYGVKTGPAAFCYWKADNSGITLVA